MVGLDKIPYAAYDHTFFTRKHPVLQIFTTESLNIIKFVQKNLCQKLVLHNINYARNRFCPTYPHRRRKRGGNILTKKVLWVEIQISREFKEKSHVYNTIKLE